MQLNLNSTIWNNKYFTCKDRNLLIKEWKAAGIFKLKHSLKDNNAMMSLNDIKSKTGTSSSRQFEYNPVKSALLKSTQAWRSKFCHKFNKKYTTFNGKPMQTITSK